MDQIHEAGSSCDCSGPAENNLDKNHINHTELQSTVPHNGDTPIDKISNLEIKIGENEANVTSKDEDINDVNKMILSSENSSNVSLENKPKESKIDKSYNVPLKFKADLALFPDILDFINSLQSYNKKLLKKIKKLKSKLKKKIKYKHVSTQTTTDDQPGEGEIKNNIKSLSEEITEAATEALQKTGFVYEETSGMYYDYNTGYYYNAEYGLYYDGQTGTYMSYNSDKKTYEFHSQVEVPPADQKSHQKIKRNITSLDREQAKKRIRRTSTDRTELEEGECSDNSTKEYEEIEIISSGDEEECFDLSNQWPPCIRIIVESSSVPSMKTGSLHIITFEGGTIGREGKHAILIPDVNISKHHLKISFDKESGKYMAVDLGSRNGTILNGKRMSSSKQESEAIELVHGSKLQVGSTHLLCHIHVGSQTCGYCEPGLIQRLEVSDKKDIIVYNKSKEHKKELNKLKKKFAINYENVPKLDPSYKDRAQIRREVVGSQNEHEKTEVTSVNEKISAANKGYKMLTKMGWSQGETLGKSKNQGLLNPIPLLSNVGTSGLGSVSAESAIPDTSADSKHKQKIRKITEQRFNESSVTDIFQSDSL